MGRDGPATTNEKAMLPPTHKLGFPRRVVVYYLLFCLSAISLLTAGAVFATQSLLQSQATEGSLSRIGRLAASLQLDHLNNGGRHTPSLLARAKTEGRFSYAILVNPEGICSVHTDEKLVGTVATEPEGSPLSWGAIDGVSFRDQRDRRVNEYAIPLSVGNESFGELRIGVVEPSWTSTMFEFGEHATLAILGPLLCVLAGGVWLVRITRPLAGIDERLADIARLPHEAMPQLEALPPEGLASVGWNRLVEHLDQLQTSETVVAPDEKIARQATAVAGGRSRKALQSLTEGIAVTDAEGRIEFANRAIEALLGVEESLEGAALEEAIAAISPKGAEPFTGARTGTVLIAEAPIASSTGGRTLRVERAPIRGDRTDNTSHKTGHIWSIRDITQQKLAEASRDSFIDTATHELRTPLANIMAYAETLAMGDVSDMEQQKEFCNTINSEATRLARFVDDLLSISSLEVGSLAINRRNTNVHRLVEEATEKIKPLMQAKSQKLDIKIVEKLGEASLDKDKVAGLLVNLLGNASKYTPEGGSITFAAIRKEEELLFEVSDTGAGIAENEQEKVFEKFFRSKNPEVRDQVGTGLGLPLAREIARLHRGDLSLTSSLGEGSTFTVVLPVQ